MSISNNFCLKRSIEFNNFCIYRLIFGVSYSLILPIIPLYFKSIGVTTTLIGLLMSLYGFSKTITQIPSGILTDRCGDKIMLQIVIFLLSSVPFIYVFSSKTSISSFAYMLQGGLLGMAAPSNYSILSRTLNKSNRGKCTGIAASVFTLGGGIGAAISGALYKIYSGFNSIFIISSIGMYISFIYIVLFIRADEKFKYKKEDSKSKILINDIFREIKERKLWCTVIVLCSASFLGDYIYGSILTIFHFYGQDVLHSSTIFTSSIISIYLFVFGMGAPFAGYICDLIGSKKQFLFSFFIMNLSLLFLIRIRNLWLFTLIISAYFLGATSLNAALQSSLSKFGSLKNIKGFVFGAVGASESLGFAIGPIICSNIYNSNKNYFFFGMLLVSSIISVIYVLLFNTSKL